MSGADVKDLDLIIVGGGPGGYDAAERAAHGGLKVLLIEKEHLGGVCLNRGCIPTKTLLAAAKHFQSAGHSADFGVIADSVRFEWSGAFARKEKTVKALRNGVAGKLRKAKVKVISGEARFIDRSSVEVNGERYSAARLLIATGSKPFVPPIPGADSPSEF